ncbi:GNAT family N-acetyltransferase [Agrococcus jejuensis]|uniref:Acetyltransferase (GNAT) family protein n=1 Tax=Agrococcus jejuensis TaxID=399736 RepID=A0A1G8FRW7_9MICO|nr:GNAT family N-acetyltransferase [Agrococcus jejuensis]SDH84676.1 Acetyltransferase (GNAT) family protein [Agrococcus jejuensis]
MRIASEDVRIRPRSARDVDPLIEVLWAQQPATRYPVRSSLPFPASQFLHADDAVAAWTAEVEGRPVGHACWLRSLDAAAQVGVDRATGRSSTAAEACATAHGCTVDELGWVSALFVDPAVRGLGVGSRLLAAVVADIRRSGMHPCLEVVDLNEAALRRYRADGWREVLRARPAWLAEAVDDAAVGTTTMVLRSAA